MSTANVRSRGLAVCAAVVVLTVACATGWVGSSMANGVDDELRASKFIVVDAEGKERAELGMVDDVVRLVVRNKERRMSIYVGIDSEGAATVGVYGKGDKALAEMGSLDGESSALMLRDAKGVRRVAVIGAAAPGVLLGDDNGKTRCSMEVGRDGSGQVRILDPRGAAIWSAAP